MKKIFNFGVFAAVLLSLLIPVFAQKERSKKDLVKEFSNLLQTNKPEDRRKAYDIGKEYLQRFGGETDDETKRIKNFVEKYGKAARPNLFNEALDKGNYAEGFVIGKEILAEEPENVYVIMNLAYGGYEALTKKSDKSFGDESTKYAKKAIAFFEANKFPKEFAPFKDKNEAHAWMYYVIGSFAIDNDRKTAAANFYKALQFESAIKAFDYPYYAIALYFEELYQKAAAEFQAKHGAKTVEDAALKADAANLEKIIDRMIDAYARAVKLNEGKQNQNGEIWKKRLTDVYKFRKQTESGLTELINNALAKPFEAPDLN